MYPSFMLDAVRHHDAASECKVFSLQEFEYFLFVRIPSEIAKQYELYQVDEIRDKDEFLCHKDLWEHDRGRIWYKFKSAMLNRESGHHTYRLSFVNTSTNDTCLLYMSYVVQTNNPGKPYLYMDEDERTCGCNG